MATKKKAVKKSAPKKKAAPRGKKTIPTQTLNLSIIGDVMNPLIDVQIKGDNKTLATGLVACYFKNSRMKEILATTFVALAELETKRLRKELNKPVSIKATPKKKK